MSENRQNGAEPKACGVFVFDEARVKRVRNAMLDEDVLQDVADTFKMLGNPTRVRILRALAEEELCVCDLSEVLGLSVSATSHQLQSLRKMKLVQTRTEGKFAYYRLRDSSVLALITECVKHLASEEAA